MTLKDTASEKAEAARQAAASAIDGAKEKVGAAYEAVVEKSSATYAAAREKAGSAYESARGASANAYGSARDATLTAQQRTTDGIEQSPLAAIAGGLALGVLIGALLPRTEKEKETLGPIGEKIADAARGALSAAKDAGREKLDELGVNPDAARGQVDKLVDTAVKAASSAGAAAAGTIKGQ